jgi:peroxiredoxin
MVGQPAPTVKSERPCCRFVACHAILAGMAALGRARALAVALATALVALAVRAEPDTTSPQIGAPAPGFSLYDTEGALVSLSDLAYKGKEQAHRPKKVVVLDFFRTDCKPCRKSLPHLVQLCGKLKGKPVQLVLVALLEEEEGEEKLKAFLAKNPLPFTVLIDTYGVVAKKYVRKGNGFELPSLFAIDRNGVLRAREGFVDAKRAEGLLGQIKRLAE